MDEQPQTPGKPPVPPPATSLAARLLNVFATPGEVFEEVQAAPPTTANWLVPAILAALVGVAVVLIQFAQPAFAQHFREQSAGTYDGMVKAGKMSQADADKFVGIIEKVAQPAGCAAVVAGSFGRVFWWALVLWLLALVFLKTKFSYLKAVEVAGLASMISVLGSIVALLLTVNFGKESAPSLALAVTDFNPKNPVHLALAAANVFDFWILGVMGVGLAAGPGAVCAGVFFGGRLLAGPAGVPDFPRHRDRSARGNEIAASDFPGTKPPANCLQLPLLCPRATKAKRSSSSPSSASR